MEQVFAPQTVAGSNITVTNTAHTLPELVETADTGSATAWPSNPTALDICPEDGDIRYTFNSQLTPTATAGYLLKQGVHKQFRGFHVKTLKFIRTGSAGVKCSIAVGIAGEDETDSFAGDGGGVGGVAALPVQAGTSTVTGVASSASDVTLLAANASRKGYKFFNVSTQVLYVKEGGVATIASGGYSYSIQPGQFYEPPASAVYTGVIHGIWASANGYANVTELT